MTCLEPTSLRLCRSALAAFSVAAALIAPGTLAQAGEGQAGQSEEAAPVTRHGGGFEFRRRFSSVDNPNCAITTYVVRDFPEQVTSTVDGNGRPVVAVDASIPQVRSALRSFPDGA